MRQASTGNRGRCLDARGRVFRSGVRAPTLICSLVHELADDEIDVAVACRVLTVSGSGCYDWLGRPASLRDQENEYVLKQIKQVHAGSRDTGGSPRVHADVMLGLGLQVNLQRDRKSVV